MHGAWEDPPRGRRLLSRLWALFIFAVTLRLTYTAARFFDWNSLFFAGAASFSLVALLAVFYGRGDWRTPTGIIRALLLTIAFGCLVASRFGSRPSLLCEGHGTNLHDPAVVQAIQAVTQFHTNLRNSQYEAACAMAERRAFTPITGLPCSEFLDYMHDVLGDQISAEVEPKPLLRGSFSGVLVVVDYQTRYPIEIAREHFEWQIDGTQAKLMSYRVSADALSR